RATQELIYHGHSGGVTAYGFLTGKQQWHQKAVSLVTFGWQTDDAVYPASRTGEVFRLNKKSGKVELTCRADDQVLSNATSPDDRYLFAGDGSSTVYCFDDEGR